MNKTEILNTILSVPGAQWARNNKTNFILIPTDEGYAKVAVSTCLAEDTGKRKAFNADAAIADYKAHEAEVALREAEKASKPARPKGPSPEAQARRDELDARITALPPFTELTATDIMHALEGQVDFTLTPMNVGQAARRLVNAEVLTVSSKEDDRRPYYTKA